jgi:hypothetical protein
MAAVLRLKVGGGGAAGTVPSLIGSGLCLSLLVLGERYFFLYRNMANQSGVHESLKDCNVLKRMIISFDPTVMKNLDLIELDGIYVPCQSP